jgi:hypothetical protein
MIYSLEGIMPADDVETAFNVTAFKVKCLALIDAVPRAKRAAWC